MKALIREDADLPVDNRPRNSLTSHILRHPLGDCSHLTKSYGVNFINYHCFQESKTIVTSGSASGLAGFPMWPDLQIKRPSNQPHQMRCNLVQSEKYIPERPDERPDKLELAIGHNHQTCIIQHMPTCHAHLIQAPREVSNQRIICNPDRHLNRLDGIPHLTPGRDGPQWGAHDKLTSLPLHSPPYSSSFPSSPRPAPCSPCLFSSSAP